MSVLIRLAFVLWLLLATLLTVSAQEPAGEADPARPEAEQAASDTQPPAAEAKPPAPEAGSASEVPPFGQLFTQWQTLLSELSELRAGYQNAEPDRQAEMKTRFNQLIVQGDAMLPLLVRAAQETCAESPGDQAAGDFLMGTIVHRSKIDDYEGVLPLAETLIEGGAPNASVYAFAGLAAFATGQFDTASEYFQAADKAHVFAALKALGPEHQRRQIGDSYRALIPYYQRTWAEEQKIRAAEAEADDLPRVLLSTNKGDIEIELFENEAPNTVANFVSLVEKGYYNGITFHRVLPGFMAQGGCPDGTGTGGPGYSIKCECTKPGYRVHFRGSLSMAKTAAPHTGGSQFFLVFTPQKGLDGQHTVFGRIIEGIEVLAKIQRRNPQAPNPPDKIIEAKVLRKRNHDYVPKITPE